MKLIGQGKAKDIYLAESGEIIFDFTDRITAFDGMKKAEIPGKGAVCCGLAAYWFHVLEAEGIPTHFIQRISENRMRVQRVKILPVEVIWRNHVAGSLWRRFQRGDILLPEGTQQKEGARIPGGMLEFTTKFEEVDRPVDTSEILEKKWMSQSEIDYIHHLTERINQILCERLARKNILLADFKVEFGKNKEGEILLADEVGTPDGCRFWDLEAYRQGQLVSLDKDIFRKSLGDVRTTYREIYSRITDN